MTHNPPTIPPAPDLATVAAAYRQAADLISTSYELRDYTDDHMDDINQAAAFLRRCADELHRADAAQPADAPRDALGAPHTAEPPAPGHGGHPGGENGPHTGTQDRAELCRQFKDAITRRWDVGPFVIDEIVDDAVDCHLQLAGRAAGTPHPADGERRQRWEGAYRRYDAYDYPNLATIGMSVADAEQAERRAPLDAPQAGDDTTGATP